MPPAKQYMTYTPLDIVGLYLGEIRQFPVLTHDQERWLCIAIECPRITLDNPELLGSNDTRRTFETYFGQLIEWAGREGRRVRRMLANNSYSYSQISEALGSLIQEVPLWQQGDQRCRSSILSHLIEWCPKEAHNSLFNLCAYLYALPAPALQFLEEYVLSRDSAVFSWPKTVPPPRCGGESLLNPHRWGKNTLK